MKKFIACITVLLLLVIMLCGCHNVNNKPEIPEGEPIIIEDYVTEMPTEALQSGFPMKGIVLVPRLNVRMEPDIDNYVSYQLDIDSEIYIYKIKVIQTEDFGDITWGQLADGMWVNLRYIDWG